MQSFDADIRRRIVALVQTILEQSSIAADVLPYTAQPAAALREHPLCLP